jgi:hypothetical protein
VLESHARSLDAQNNAPGAALLREQALRARAGVPATKPNI